GSHPAHRVGTRRPRRLCSGVRRERGGRAVPRLHRARRRLMCGIAGLVTNDGRAPSANVMTTMSETLAHRGPDGIGHYRSGDVAMMQRRLAIIDLVTGDQPLYEPAGAALVANRAIYNYI